MTIDNEIISFVLSGAQMGGSKDVASYFKLLSEIADTSQLNAEFIVVVPYSNTDFQGLLKKHSMNNPIQIVVVGERNSWDQEMFAGLSRANGDYTLIIGDSLRGLEELFPKMLGRAKSNLNDVIGVRNSVSAMEHIKYLRTEILLRSLRKRTKAPLSISNSNDLLITRKALNWILRDLSTAQCMIEMYLIPGLSIDFVETDSIRSRYKLSRPMYSRLITRYTLVPQTILKACFFTTVLFMVFVSLNALSVRWRGVNLLNQVEAQIPGWTTLVLLVSFGFSVIIYALYIILKTILHLAEEYSTKPNHIIKSVQRP